MMVVRAELVDEDLWTFSLVYGKSGLLNIMENIISANRMESLLGVSRGPEFPQAKSCSQTATISTKENLLFAHFIGLKSTPIIHVRKGC
jgi:hypothetical protein